MKDKTKMYDMVLGVVLFILLIAGFTYAALNWESVKTNIGINTNCFDIYYDKGQDINGTLIPSSDYTGGLYATVKMNVKTSCNVSGNGTLYLNTLSTTSTNLYTRGLLKYQVVKGTTPIAGQNGTITKSGEIALDIGELTKATSATTTYKVYVWIDEAIVENTDAYSKYNGKISASATQK